MKLRADVHARVASEHASLDRARVREPCAATRIRCLAARRIRRCRTSQHSESRSLSARASGQLPAGSAQKPWMRSNGPALSSARHSARSLGPSRQAERRRRPAEIVNGEATQRIASAALEVSQRERVDVVRCARARPKSASHDGTTCSPPLGCSPPVTTIAILIVPARVRIDHGSDTAERSRGDRRPAQALARIALRRQRGAVAIAVRSIARERSASAVGSPGDQQRPLSPAMARNDGMSVTTGTSAARHRFDQRVAAAFGVTAADQDVGRTVVIRASRLRSTRPTSVTPSRRTHVMRDPAARPPGASCRHRRPSALARRGRLRRPARAHRAPSADPCWWSARPTQRINGDRRRHRLMAARPLPRLPGASSCSLR